MSDRVKQLILEAEEAGAIGATQNMLGKVVHAVVTKEKTSAVLDIFKRHLPRDRIMNSEIDFEGGRLLG
jgi:pantoate kinase